MVRTGSLIAPSIVTPLTIQVVVYVILKLTGSLWFEVVIVDRTIKPLRCSGLMFLVVHGVRNKLLDVAFTVTKTVNEEVGGFVTENYLAVMFTRFFHLARPHTLRRPESYSPG